MEDTASPVVQANGRILLVCDTLDRPLRGDYEIAHSVQLGARRCYRTLGKSLFLLAGHHNQPPPVANELANANILRRNETQDACSLLLGRNWNSDIIKVIRVMSPKSLDYAFRRAAQLCDTRGRLLDFGSHAGGCFSKFVVHHRAEVGPGVKLRPPPRTAAQKRDGNYLHSRELTDSTQPSRGAASTIGQVGGGCRAWN